MSPYIAIPKAVALALPMMFGAWTVQAADLIQTAQQDGRFNDFLHLLETTGMIEKLQGGGPFTVFAPTDQAFDQLPQGTLDRFLAAENRKPLEVVIQSHIVAAAAIRAGELLGRAVEVPTLGGGTLAIDGTTGVILLVPIGVTITEVTEVGQAVMEELVDTLQDPLADAVRPTTLAVQEMGVATVVEPDIEADNGVMHVIDSVLLPPEVLWAS
jgi:uncharacterized surface protein with fasciclin (FAS1) repeats